MSSYIEIIERVADLDPFVTGEHQGKEYFYCFFCRTDFSKRLDIAYDKHPDNCIYRQCEELVNIAPNTKAD